MAAGTLMSSAEVVVDTDVVSYLYKRDSRAERYRPHLDRRLTVISAQTLGELYHWPDRRNWGAARRREFESFLLGYYVHYPDRETCRTYGHLTAAARRSGFVVPATDAWHAATALRLGLALVTHNAHHFLGVPDLVILTEQEDGGPRGR
jgi:predicted nucleic acid-binding protein